MYNFNNKKIGSRFEREFAKELFQKGYWVHIIAPDIAGRQPADIIAIKGNKHILVDCKVCTKNEFLFSRIEDNQRLAMKDFTEKANSQAWFALRTQNGIFMISYRIMLKAEEKFKTKLTMQNIADYCMPFESWCL